MRALTSWDSRPPVSRQAADPAEQRGPETDPGTAPHRDAVPSGANARAVIRRLNPIIRGWAAYYRTVVSSEVYTTLDSYMWKLTQKWAVFSHSNKSKHWVIARYFGQFNKSRHDRWVFGDRDSGAYLRKFAWTRIVRHQVVKGTASPDDPALADYWAKRRHKAPPPPIGATNLRLLEAQTGRCPLCGSTLLDVDDLPQSPREWEQWLAATHKAILRVAIAGHGTADAAEPRLIHAHCRHRSKDGSGPALLPAHEP